MANIELDFTEIEDVRKEIAPLGLKLKVLPRTDGRPCVVARLTGEAKAIEKYLRKFYAAGDKEMADELVKEISCSA